MDGAKALDEAMDERRKVIGKRWQVVARDAGMTPQHLSRIRNGGTPLNTFSAASIDRALNWPTGHAWKIFTSASTATDDAPELLDDNERKIWSMDLVDEDLRRDYIRMYRAKKARQGEGERETG